MDSSSPSILVVTTFAKDTMVYVETGERESKPGGPGHWIKETYDRMGVKFTALTSDREVNVEMELVNGEPLPGKIIANGSKIVVDRPMKYDGVVINFLDDFDLDQLSLIEGTVLLDIAAYTRDGIYKQQRRMVPLPSKEIREKINIIKTNDEEFPWIPEEWVKEQRDERILLHTLGKRGVDLWVRGELTHFDPPKEKPKNVLGAGDTFGAAFLYHILVNGGDAISATTQAVKEIRELFIQKAA